MEKQLLYTDQSKINQSKTKITSAINAFKPFFEEYKQLNIGDLKTEDLKTFFIKPKEFFMMLLTKGENLKVGDLMLDPEKLYELLQKPEGVEDLVNNIEKTIRLDEFRLNHIGYIDHIIVSEGQMLINPEYIRELTDKYTFYTETSDQLKAFELVKRIAEDFSELKNLLKEPEYAYYDDFRTFMIKESNDAKKYDSNIEAIARYF